jgi:YD repeat-containing protein
MLTSVNPYLIPTFSLRERKTSCFSRFSYDTLRRLISVTPTSTGNTEAYTYDKTGNRKTNATNSSTIHYTTNSLDQYITLTGITNTSYTYDSNGNLKTDGSRTFTYDYQNRLIAVTQSGTTLASYQYDPLGRRIQKSTPTETTRYTYAGDNIIGEKKTIGGITLKKVYIN